MATAIELLPLATRSSTTKTDPQVQPREVETLSVSGATDLDTTTADERAVNLSLAWEQVDNGDARERLPILEVAIEASADQITWDEVARFPRVALGERPSGVHAIGFVAPTRYLRASYRLAPGHQGKKGSCRFSVAGKKS